MNFDSVRFVRFLSTSGSLSRSSISQPQERMRSHARYTDLTRIQNFSILANGKAETRNVLPLPSSSIRGDIYDDALTPTVENGKRWRALRGGIRRLWDSTGAGELVREQ